jgi:hypothetical protein
MALPKVDMHGKQVILLSGFDNETKSARSTVRAITIDSEKKLSQAALRNPDAVAFGFVAGKWIPAA